MVTKLLLTAILLVVAGAANAGKIVFSEDFDDVAALAGGGWTQVNNSTAGGTTGWFQGIDGVFGSQAGAPDSYVAANFNNAAFAGNISNWLITPAIALSVDMTLDFFTRASGFLPDRLEVRLSTNGASGDVGGTDSSVGDFTTLLAVVNPLLGANYPVDWSVYSLDLGDIADGTLGRIAFRYFADDTSVNADYLGIDSVRVAVPEPGTLALFALALFALSYAIQKSKTESKASSSSEASSPD